jgi:hypothetical protein
MKSALRITILATLILTENSVFADDKIPAQLVGVWATDGAVLKGRLLYEGSAFYLGADGVGAAVGGPPPIGVKIIATFNKETNVIEFDAYEGQQKGPHGTLLFDEKSKTLDSNPSKNNPYHRRFNDFSDETKKALGIQ